MKELQNIYVSPENAVLVVVDMENGFCKPEGWRYTEMSARIMPGVITAIQGLVSQAHSAGIPVIYIQSVRTLKEPEFTVFGREPHLEMGPWA
ncbi:MAG: isochorismatase family protein, partial [Dehalococcoidia bacterium]|nr:isochorismatase family protein [Dehalococcoidia bacterium]